MRKGKPVPPQLYRRRWMSLADDDTLKVSISVILLGNRCFLHFFSDTHLPSPNPSTPRYFYKVPSSFLENWFRRRRDGNSVQKSPILLLYLLKLKWDHFEIDFKPRVPRQFNLGRARARQIIFKKTLFIKDQSVSGARLFCAWKMQLQNYQKLYSYNCSKYCKYTMDSL